MNFAKEKDLEEILEQLNLEIKKVQKKRMFSFIIALFAGVVAAAMYDIYYFIPFVILGFILYKYEYWSLKKKLKMMISNKQVEFVNLFSYLLIFLENGMNTYQALKASEEYLEDGLHSLLTTLISEIDNDKSSTPYVKFATHFSSELILQIMLLLYQFEENGYSEEHLRRFSVTLSRLKENTMSDHVKKVSQSLNVYCYVPVVTTILLTLAFSISILDGLGGILNG